MAVMRPTKWKKHYESKPDIFQKEKDCANDIGDARVVGKAKHKKRFLLGKLLGVGGLCEVFEATDLLRVSCGDQAPKVAIKRLLPEYANNSTARELLVREFVFVRQFNCSGIVRVNDVHETSFGLALSMEVLHGTLLSDAGKSRPSGFGAKVLPMAKELFAVLALLHENSVCHGDIKPANLMLEGESRLVLFDFNTAQVCETVGARSSALCRSLHGDLRLPAFSPLYASPKRLEGECPSKADDVFSACCSLFELAHGMHPYSRKTSLEALKRKMKPPILVGVPRGLRKLLERGVALRAEERPTAQELTKYFSKTTLFKRLISNGG